jgi:stearoyl-CoA desaturase (Delta-9 desaturase)
MTFILLVFFAHWWSSLFFHTLYLHRYASHKMFTTGVIREKLFHFMTWVTQGSSYLVPKAYAVMHRMHHAHSDTEQDPHSPHFFSDVIGMMKHTAIIYKEFVNGTKTAASEFCHDLPSWTKFERIANHNITRIAWMAAYTILYIFLINHFHLSYFWLLLLPIHFLMGPVQGAIVNWCGHKYGYQNFDNGDHSHNTGPFGVLLLGELFQNNHHKFPTSANFAKKWFEFDLTYIVMFLMDKVGIIKLI